MGSPRRVVLLVRSVLLLGLATTSTSTSTSTNLANVNGTANTVNIDTTGSVNVPQSSDYPTNITLRTATIDVIPFVFYENDENGNGTITGGFLVDLLEELKNYAWKDGVNLTFDIDRGPESYNAALDYLADDCLELELDEPENCDRYDFILADYWPNPARYARVDFSPRWLETGLCTMKYVHESKTLLDVTTLNEAAQARAIVCTVEASILPGMLANSFPRVIQHLCPTNEACIEQLKAQECSLFAQDYLTLLYRSLRDPTVQVTQELFLTQPVVFPIRRDLDPTVTYLFKRWLYFASYESTFDRLFQKYFSVQRCAIGTSGLNCTEPCDPTHGTSDAIGQCICESTKWTGDDCSIEVLEELNLIPDTLKICGYAMFAINLATVLFCLGWLYWKRDTPQVVVAQPLFLSLILLGCAISTSTILALTQQDSSGFGTTPIPACMIAPWLYSCGFCVTFGSLYAKIRRVRIIFESAARMHRVSVGKKETLTIVGAILSLDVTILILWTILDPLEWTRVVLSADKFGSTLESEGYCTCNHWKAWAGTIIALHGCLLLFASYTCYASRNISTVFSEGKYLAIAMVSNLQIFLVGLPVLVMIGGDPETSYFVRCIMIFVNDLAVVLLVS